MGTRNKPQGDKVISKQIPSGQKTRRYALI